jgi:DNA polymerase III sliding clamp (beta) subunit (PCNA family)
MLSKLKFVQGAVSKKDFLPALTHFRIQDGTVRSFNGTLALCSPIPLDIDCVPKAESLVRAIQHCDETVTLSLTPTGKLSVRSGAFKALIDCVQEDTPHVVPEGERFDFDGEALLTAIKTVAPFIGDDASRPWSNGVLLLGQSAFATNNITLVEYWVGSAFPICCNVPRAAIKEMLRIGEPPIWAQATDNSITFHYSGERWIRSQLFETQWPDLSKVLGAESNLAPIDERLFAALVKLKPFADKLGRVFLKDGVVSTHEQHTEGASFDIPDLQVEGIYQIEMLALLQGVAQQIDFGAYPKPCMFQGERLRGAIVGMRPL